MAPFLLRGLTWAMLYVWTKNYPQVVGTCSGHHGQLISQNCVLKKIRAEPPPLNHVIFITVTNFFGNHGHKRFSTVFLILKTIPIKLKQIKPKLQYLVYESIIKSVNIIITRGGMLSVF